MNYPMIGYILSRILLFEAGFLLVPLLTAAIYGEPLLPFLITMAVLVLVSAALGFRCPQKTAVYAREGFVIVSLAWILLSVFGALPFVLSGDIPSVVDAFFETVSGFTTTGATILEKVEPLSRGCVMWRAFTHWVGGMGVLVFVMTVLPSTSDGHTMHLVRAEVPGPTSGKLVSRMSDSAKILYSIYFVLTVVLFVLLLAGGMSCFDALLHAFSTAGTGGYSSMTLSVGAFDSAYIDIVLGIFMMVFGINFNLYYFLLMRRFRDVLRSEELWTYLAVVAAAVLCITVNIAPIYQNVGTSLRHAFFQVTTIISTTGYATVNFDTWPTFSKTILMTLMFVGSCAGSTAGGLKMGRLVILAKSAIADMRKMLHPNAITTVRYEGKVLSERDLRGAYQYVVAYVFMFLFFCLALSLEGQDMITTVTAVITCHNNAGPGLGLVGPAGNYAFFSDPAKLLLSFNMLLGRLEIFPMLLLFTPSVWVRRGSRRHKKA